MVMACFAALDNFGRLQAAQFAKTALCPFTLSEFGLRK